MVEPVIGKVMINDTCINIHVVNEINVPILCMGCRDMIIAARGDGILIADKEQSSYIKPFIDDMDQQAMYAEKSWGASLS